MTMLARAAAFLIGAQDGDGAWRDYDIRNAFTRDSGVAIGTSDQWVTAFVGVALAEYAEAAGDRSARVAARAAAGWLDSARAYPAGFGFNARTGPDTDSTAYAVQLFRALGQAPEPSDLAFLEGAWVPGEGYATFPGGPGQWGRGHADLIGPIVLALGRAPEGLAATLARRRQADGLWPAYWWATPHYGSFWIVEATAGLGLRSDPVPPQAAPPQNIASPWIADMAYAVGLQMRLRGAAGAPPALLDGLVRQQGAAGGWPGAAALRVPDQSDPAPWSHRGAPAHCDQRGLMTTAHLLRCLTRLGAGVAARSVA